MWSHTQGALGSLSHLRSCPVSLTSLSCQRGLYNKSQTTQGKVPSFPSQSGCVTLGKFLQLTVSSSERRCTQGSELLQRVNKLTCVQEPAGALTPSTLRDVHSLALSPEKKWRMRYKASESRGGGRRDLMGPGTKERGQEQRTEALVRQVWTRRRRRLLARSWESPGEAEDAGFLPIGESNTTMGRADRTLETMSCSSFDPRGNWGPERRDY